MKPCAILTDWRTLRHHFPATTTTRRLALLVGSHPAVPLAVIYGAVVTCAFVPLALPVGLVVVRACLKWREALR